MRRWLHSIKFGVLLGVFFALSGLWMNCAYYFRYHLFNKGLLLLVSCLNNSVLTWTILAFATYLLIRICIRFCDKYIVTALLLPATVLYVRLVMIPQGISPASIWFGLRHLSKDYDTSVLLDAVRSGIIQIIAALLVVTVGLWLLKRVKGQDREHRVGLFAKGGVLIQRGVGVIAGVCLKLNYAFVPILVLILFVNIALVCTRMARSVTSRPKPNVVFIMLDTVRADHVGCYGYSRNTTPNIDRFARSSTQFEHAVAQAPMTEWSVPSFLASRYPQAGMEQYPTLQEFLSDQGYDTGAIVSNAIVSEYGDGSDPHAAFNYWHYTMDKDKASNGIAPTVTAAALKWLDSVRSKRFFLFTLFIDAHAPYTKYRKHDFDPENDGKLPNTVNVGIQNNDPSKSAPGDVYHMKALYDSGIAFEDEYVGLILDKLKHDGVYDKSLIVILADHGEEFRDHGAFFHSHTLYNELLSVPLAVKLPGQTRGQVVKGSFTLVDLFPSIVSTLGCDPSQMKLQGNPIHLAGLKGIRDRYLFSANEKKRSIQDSQFKLVLTLATSDEPERLELYQKKSDMNEQHNLAAAMPQLTAHLRGLLLDHDKAIGTQSGVTYEHLPKGDKNHQALKSLGYLAQ